MIPWKSKPSLAGMGVALFLRIALAASPSVHANDFAADLPAGVRAVWDPGQAHRE